MCARSRKNLFNIREIIKGNFTWNDVFSFEILCVLHSKSSVLSPHCGWLNSTGANPQHALEVYSTVALSSLSSFPECPLSGLWLLFPVLLCYVHLMISDCLIFRTMHQKLQVQYYCRRAPFACFLSDSLFPCSEIMFFVVIKRNRTFLVILSRLFSRFVSTFGLSFSPMDASSFVFDRLLFLK